MPNILMALMLIFNLGFGGNAVMAQQKKASAKGSKAESKTENKIKKAESSSPVADSTMEMLYLNWPQEWELAEHEEKGDRLDLIFTKAGDNPSQWKEVGTVAVKWWKQNTNLEEFLYDNNSALMNSCEEQRVKVIEKNLSGRNISLIYTLNFANCGGKNTAPQSWICLLVQGNDHFYICQYGSKKKDFSAAEIEQWKNFFKTAQLVRIPGKPPVAKP